MKTSYDLAGQKFGNLTPIDVNEREPRGGTYWNCLCDCGNKTVARADHLKKGMRKSCGCLKKRKGPRNEANRSKCAVCGIDKNPRDFYKRKGTHDGLSTRCKECTRKNARIKARKYSNQKRVYEITIPRKKAAVMAKKQKKVAEYGRDVVDFQDEDYSSSISYGDAMKEIYGY